MQVLVFGTAAAAKFLRLLCAFCGFRFMRCFCRNRGNQSNSYPSVQRVCECCYKNVYLFYGTSDAEEASVAILVCLVVLICDCVFYLPTPCLLEFVVKETFSETKIEILEMVLRNIIWQYSIYNAVYGNLGLIK